MSSLEEGDGIPYSSGEGLPRQRRSAAFLMLLGVLLLQTAWAVSIPPFRGTDEFDHAYRAAAVARGQWAPTWSEARNGRGRLLAVPSDIVNVAHPICIGYEYVGRDNCTAVRRLGNGQVLVASAATTYNPVFYWLVGTPARWLRGAAALYAMRITGAVLSAIFVFMAAWAVTIWSRTQWPILMLAFGMTPVMLFSTAVVAPNGIEMCAGLALWAALLGLATARGRGHTRQLFLISIASAVPLITVRTLGPMWFALITGTCVLVIGRDGARDLARRNRTLTTAFAVVAILTVVVSVWWTSVAGATRLEPYSLPVDNPMFLTIRQIPLWFLQTIAAFPRRRDPAPLLVYAVFGITLLGMVVAGAATASRRLRIIIYLGLVIGISVPVALTLWTVRTAGPIWQGRYGIPYLVGLALLCGLGLDGTTRVGRPRSALVILTGATIAVGHLVAIVHVLDRERRTSPLVGTAEWHVPANWIVGCLVAVGVAALLGAVAASDRRMSTDPEFEPD